VNRARYLLYPPTPTLTFHLRVERHGQQLGGHNAQVIVGIGRLPSARDAAWIGAKPRFASEGSSHDVESG
jgi:hypothetical protein